MAVVAREVVALADYCQMVATAAEPLPWLTADCWTELLSN